jgi:GldL N-terminal domain
MPEFNPDIYFRKYRKLRIYLLILLPFLIIFTLYLWYKYDEINFLIGIFLILALNDIGIIIGLFTKKFYNWIFIFLFLILLGFVSKINQLPFSEALYCYGFGGLATVSFYLSIIFLKRFNHVPFLKYLGFSTSIVLLMFNVGLLFKISHWNGAGFLLNVGIIAFIPFLFAMIFTLPSSKYVNWGKNERAAFFRALIIPMAFFFILSSLMFIFPEIWSSIMNPHVTPWSMVPIELFEKAGLH